MEIFHQIVAAFFGVLSILMSVVIDERHYRLIMHNLGLAKISKWVLRHH